MKIVLVYIYPFNGRDGRRANAERFMTSYLAYNPGMEHELVVVSNGEPPTEESEKLFGMAPNYRMFYHDNSGYDIGAFQHVARETTCDLMVFFGNSAYLRMDGWLKRMADVYAKHGDKLYGSMQNAGFIPGGVWPHIRTTGFWMKPILLLRYPILVVTPQQRYPFEHGRDCLTSFCHHHGGAMAVTMNNAYPISQWHRVEEGYHSGSQSQMLTGDRMSCPPFYPVP